MKNKKQENKSTFGKKLNKNGVICVTDRGRFFGSIDGEHHVGLIITTIEELEKVVKKAKKSKNALVDVGIFFTHLSPDVTFGILPKKDKWLVSK